MPPYAWTTATTQLTFPLDRLVTAIALCSDQCLFATEHEVSSLLTRASQESEANVACLAASYGNLRLRLMSPQKAATDF